MKVLNINGEKFKADKIIKTNTDITGRDNNGVELFAFRGISDFSGFILEEGQAFDTSEPTIADLQAQIFNLTTQLINGGAL